MNSIREQIFGGEKAERRSLLGQKRKKGAGAALTSVSIPRAEARLSDSREGDRHRLVDEKVNLKLGRKSRKVELINLSGGGAMIGGEIDAKIGDKAELHLGEGATLECAVRWIKNGRIGLEFAHETRIDCAPRERAELLRQVIARSFPETAVEIATPEAPDKPRPTKVETQPTGEGRGDFRHPLIWSGQIHYDFDSTPVRLRNISKTGALIECAIPLPVGSEPLLDLGEAGSVFARVSWAYGDQVGLAFQTEFDLSDLVKSRPDLTAPSWDAPSYLREEKASGTPWDDPWKRLSVRELSEELEGYLKH